MHESNATVLPTTESELIRWIDSNLREFGPMADQPIGSSGTVYLPVAGAPGTAKRISLHAPSLGYTCWRDFCNLVDRICSVNVATELWAKFPPASISCLRDLLLAMKWLKARCTRPMSLIDDVLIHDPIRLSITEAAKYIGVTDRTVRKWRRNRKLTVVEDESGQLIFSKSSLEVLRLARK